MPLVADPPQAPPADPFAGVDVRSLPPALPALIEAAHGRIRTGRAVLRPRAKSGDSPSADRRRAPRFRVGAEVMVRAVDERGRPTGSPFRAVVADLSTGGLRLFHSRFIRATHLAVQVPLCGRETAVVLKVIRAAAMGAYYEFSGPLVSRLDDVGA